MGGITVELLRKRAEHNEGLIATLEEVALHQQSIERIEVLGHACRHLKILYLQNNLISKLENLHRLKELEYLNLAVNNITCLENLQGCESLAKLDLTINFVPKAGLLNLAQLQANIHLRELYLIGNPCADWDGYRPYAIASVPQLEKLDGVDISPAERKAAEEQLSELEQRLRRELAAEDASMAAGGALQSDSSHDTTVGETGVVGEDGELRRPWCPETRVLEHQEAERVAQEAEAKRKRCQNELFNGLGDKKEVLHEDFPPVVEGEEVRQRNEGKWGFTLQESEDGAAILLDVAVGPYLDLSCIKADVQPTYARLLVKGRLLQLRLPQEVRPDSSTAQRSAVTGHLLLTMPKEDHRAAPDPTCHRGPTGEHCVLRKHSGRSTAVAARRSHRLHSDSSSIERPLATAQLATPGDAEEGVPPL